MPRDIFERARIRVRNEIKVDKRVARLFDRIPRNELIESEAKPFRTHIPVSRILIGTLRLVTTNLAL